MLGQPLRPAKTPGEHTYALSPDEILEVHVGTEELLRPFFLESILCHTESYLLFQTSSFSRTRTLWRKQVKSDDGGGMVRLISKNKDKLKTLSEGR